MAPRIPKRQLTRARKMRREQTFAEEVLWNSLRDRQCGAKFRRQVPIGAFVVDFACVEAKLVVEVDGPSHASDIGRLRDAQRDAVLRAQGWRVVRVSNELATHGPVLDAIRAALGEER